MSAAPADSIHAHLAQVEQLRAARQADAALAAQVTALKTYQARRFATTYADLLAHPRYQAAAQFFLDDLYGPHEFAQRDAQFNRVVPALVRLFPKAVVTTVAQLAALHALSESLDDATARHLQRQQPPSQPQGSGLALDVRRYTQAWQATGRVADRERQIALTITIGQALEAHTRSRVLRTSLRLMRGPAQAAGLSALQRFLEAGFDAFGRMHGADDFLRWVGERERALAAALFSAELGAELGAELDAALGAESHAGLHAGLRNGFA